MIDYRQATRNEFNLAVEWAAAEGWNPGLDDADIFWETDPTGFVCAENDGEVIATGSIVRYGQDFGFMGFFIVRPDLRGQGIGRDFWYWRRDTLRSRLKPNAPIGMDGVFDMQPFYARGGFEFAHRNLRMQGISQQSPQDTHVVPLDKLPLQTIASYDQRHFGYARPEFLKSWIRQKGNFAVGLINEGQLKGIGVIRACRQGHKIGPLFADDADCAEQIFCALTSHVAGQTIYLDIPENNPAAVQLAAEYGLEEVFGCARMYHGSIPTLPWEKIYGITTFELG
ncbi:MAG: GNAT family N-acetyltransferase [Verrucomicrobiota bacterium]